MPTPVSSARQCLTDDAARALDEAVAVARRRSHSQTTSLHAVSALLSLPTSTLRDACARARSSAYSPRLQFRALDLCVGVSLDRLPSSKAKTLENDEPPVSNSLMAAIKRSQANQRRHPETFHLYQMHQQSYGSQSSLACIKVELKHFILSILDDPIVSRVFGDAGFRSSDIKIAILRPPSVSGFQKSGNFPPVFLCNLPDSSNGNRTGINFPFAVDQKEEDVHRLISPNGSQLKSSLMGSFVPFAGFFPSQAEQSATRCDTCNQKYEQEASIISNGGQTMPVADQQSAGLASWLRVPESDSTNVIEAKDRGGVGDARIMGLQRKWSDICHRLGHNLPSGQDPSRIQAGITFPRQFQPGSERVEINGQDSNQETRCSKSLSSSTATIRSITTDLGLRPIHVAPDPGLSPAAREARETRIQTFNGFGSGELDETSKHVSNEKDFKQLYTALADKVGYQHGSIRAISQTITRIRAGPERRCVWFMFSGPDPVSKRKISSVLAEVVFGSQESLISIDLNFENQISEPSSIFNRRNVNFSDASFRGKNAMEFIAEELAKKPQSVVLLEHVDKADFVTKDNISKAIRTGKLSDARGRETRITDAIFVFTTSSIKEENGNEFLSYSEERILNAKASQMRISVEKTEPRSSSLLLSPKDSVSRNPESLKKRKIIELGDFEVSVPEVKKLKPCFDLNLPLEETEETDNDNDTVSETKDLWLDEFLDQVDEKVVFDPFDFDSRAETILKRVSECFKKSFGRNFVLEIDTEVMVQILASAWVSDENGGAENWIESVLYRGFMEVKQKGVDDESVVKLVVVEGVKIEDDDALCVCLPSRIMVK
ncbi:hypothetical protein SSX86_022399 [Deinandra increscens subsp. villosa]|uniref:Clp R domain-containing protein n=1 Tax=Deinandra increscens subsp. villosa TaxID=3103831 RepID=A0AAP0CQJ4_9ASTR